MLYSIICFFGALLILCGAFFVFHLVLSAVITKSDGDYFIVVDGHEENERLAEQIYSAFVQVNMMNFSSKRPVYVIDRNLSDNTKEYLISLHESLGEIIFMKADEGVNPYEE